jgi:hypothetical protein
MHAEKLTVDTRRNRGWWKKVSRQKRSQMDLATGWVPSGGNLIGGHPDRSPPLFRHYFSFVCGDEINPSQNLTPALH